VRSGTIYIAGRAIHASPNLSDAWYSEESLSAASLALPRIGCAP
jgi:hypothetical protein